MRPADSFVRLANQFSATVEVAKAPNEDQFVDGKSILSILTLAADKDSELIVQAHGADDAEAAVKALVELIERGFAEDAQEDGTQLAGEH